MDKETKNFVSVRSTRRWVLVPDEEKPSRMLWEWAPWGADDIDELFNRVANRTASEEDHELFGACMLDRFITRVHSGEPVEQWILESLANTFCKILLGGEWNDELLLPGRTQTPIRPWRDDRDLRIYCDVANTVNSGNMDVTDAITQAAAEHAVSFETARAGYYRWKNSISKNNAKP